MAGFQVQDDNPDTGYRIGVTVVWLDDQAPSVEEMQQALTVVHARVFAEATKRLEGKT